MSQPDGQVFRCLILGDNRKPWISEPFVMPNMRDLTFQQHGCGSEFSRNSGFFHWRFVPNASVGPG
jgi:hypothetical protein